MSVLGLSLTLGSLGCGGGTFQKVDMSQEFPEDIQPGFKKKFELKDHLEPVAVTKKSAKKKLRQVSRSKKEKPSSVVGGGERVVPPSPPVFPSRRPAKDAFEVGERLTYTITYLGIPAGDFTLEVLPFRFMGNRKVYHLRGHAMTGTLASLIYRADDVVESFFDFEGLFSHRFHLVLDESKQKRDSLELNDYEKKETFFWNRWNHRDRGYTDTKKTVEIKFMSQDTLSALYYIRTVPLPEGAMVSMPVVSEGRCWEAIATVVRREMMSTPLGKVQTIVIEPDTKYEGVLKKSGTSYLWLTDDDRKIPVRLEAKVKIGSVVAKLKKVESVNFSSEAQNQDAQAPEMKFEEVKHK